LAIRGEGGARRRRRSALARSGAAAMASGGENPRGLVAEVWEQEDGGASEGKGVAAGPDKEKDLPSLLHLHPLIITSIFFNFLILKIFSVTYAFLCSVLHTKSQSDMLPLLIPPCIVQWI
jgi:hypothetical protein